MAVAVVQIGHMGVAVRHWLVRMGVGVPTDDRLVVMMVVVPVVVAVLMLVLHRLVLMEMVVG